MMVVTTIKGKLQMTRSSFEPWATAPAWAYELRDALASNSLKLDVLVREILTPRLVVRLGQPTDKEIS